MKGMKKNDQAVSPVIGVILMVVITVIIAAILAVFAFGIGGPQKSPEVNLKFSAVDDGIAATKLKISHEGGDALILKDERMTAVLASDGTTDAISGSTTTVTPVALDAWNTGTASSLAAGYVIEGPLDHLVAPAGTIIEVKIVDTPTGQLISRARVVVQ